MEPVIIPSNNTNALITITPLIVSQMIVTGIITNVTPTPPLVNNSPTPLIVSHIIVTGIIIAVIQLVQLVPLMAPPNVKVKTFIPVLMVNGYSPNQTLPNVMGVVVMGMGVGVLKRLFPFLV